MSTKVYVLLDLVHADGAHIDRVLRGNPGVTTVDILEGPPDIVMLVKVSERQRAADYLMDILDSVDGMTENLTVLPVQECTGKGSLAEIVKRNTGLERKLKEEVQL